MSDCNSLPPLRKPVHGLHPHFVLCACFQLATPALGNGGFLCSSPFFLFLFMPHVQSQTMHPLPARKFHALTSLCTLICVCIAKEASGCSIGRLGSLYLCVVAPAIMPELPCSIASLCLPTVLCGQFNCRIGFAGWRTIGLGTSIFATRTIPTQPSTRPSLGKQNWVRASNQPIRVFLFAFWLPLPCHLHLCRCFFCFNWRP
jgi:hypothetical protein